jgi:hypothetical protein
MAIGVYLAIMWRSRTFLLTFHGCAYRRLDLGDRASHGRVSGNDDDEVDSNDRERRRWMSTGWLCTLWRSWSLPCLPLMFDRSRSPGGGGNADQDQPRRRSYGTRTHRQIYIYDGNVVISHRVDTLDRPYPLSQSASTYIVHHRSSTRSNRTKHTRIVTFVMATNTFLNMASLSDKNISLYFIPIASRSAPRKSLNRSSLLKLTLILWDLLLHSPLAGLDVELLTTRAQTLQARNEVFQLQT